MKSELTHLKAQQLVHDAWWAGVKAVNGYNLVLSELESFDYSSVSHVLAVGKAAGSMMLAAKDKLEGGFKGLVITKYGHLDQHLSNNTNIECIESGHPIPDENSLSAGRRALDFVGSVTENDHLLMLVSGGASALLEVLQHNMPLDALQSLSDNMLSSGKTIAQINARRSEISLIKNAKLLNRCKAACIVTLAVSDVQGDNIYVIGSGIGACDLPNYKVKVLGSNKVARQAIADYFRAQQTQVVLNQESLYGELYEIAADVAADVIGGPNGAYIFGGETVITLPASPGIGGRNQSLALAIAGQIKDHDGIMVLVAGSDGTDGPTEAAGGWVDSSTFDSQQAQQALDRADAGTYLKSKDSLFVTGPTGTNVMDLAIALKW